MLSNAVLINYGVLGMWTATLLYDRYTTIRNLKRVIVENTKILQRLETVLDERMRL